MTDTELDERAKALDAEVSELADRLMDKYGRGGYAKISLGILKALSRDKGLFGEGTVFDAEWAVRYREKMLARMKEAMA